MPPVTIDHALQVALEHHQAGHLNEAESIYRQILNHQPNHADALHLLGVIAHQVGSNDLAVDLIGRAVAIKPNYPEALNNLGNALQAKKRIDEAITCFRRVVELQPDHFGAFTNLGNALQIKGQSDEAIAACRQALAIKPDLAEAHNNLGNALQGKKQHDAAIAAYRQAIAFKSHYPEAYNNLSNALRARGQLDEAIAACRQALALNPGMAEAYNNLGNALKDQGQLDAAIAAYRQAIAIEPNYAEAYNNLGTALQAGGHTDEAIAVCRQALAFNPGLADAHNNLGNSLHGAGQLEAAIAAYCQAIALKPDEPVWNSNRLYMLHFDPAGSPADLLEHHRQWYQRLAQPLRPRIQPPVNDRNPDRRLKIGFVSPDFRHHSVAFFLLPLLEAHHRAQYHFTCYSNNTISDHVTQRIRQCVEDWRNIKGLADEDAAALIRQDRIDILVDLAGHTSGNRLMLLAHKPAPVQVTYLGYPGTTGLETIDYRLTDEYADPVGSSEKSTVEQLIRLPQTAWCFSPISGSPDVNLLPARNNGFLTLGTFSNFAKINPQLLEWWARILQQIADSQLLLKNLATGSSQVTTQLQKFFAARGIAPERLKFMAHEASAGNHLLKYHELDIALDTFPYHGTTTTCEALWMGVPVVTLAGKVHASRVGVSLLSNAGLPELIASNADDYVRIAVELAGDLPRLEALRTNQRERMRQSPLMDAASFTGHVESAFRHMWHAWCSARES